MIGAAAREAFPRRRDFRSFLRDSGETFAELDLFVAEFNRKWRAQTACRPPWLNEFYCGDGPAPR
jgi:hypothetical protein